MTRPPFRPEDLLAHSEWARALAQRLVVDDATADDLVQETFLQALRTPPALAGPLRPWLSRVLTNVARMRARGEGRRSRREEHTARGEALPSVLELTERTEAQRLLMETLLELDEAKRQVVLLRYFEGLSSAEIARRQGLPAGTVRARLKQGLDNLRTRLAERFDGDDDRWQRALLPLALPPATAAKTLTVAGLLTGALWMKISLYAMTATASLLLLGLALLRTGMVDWPLGDPPIESVRFEPLAPALPASAETDWRLLPPEETTEARSEVAEKETQPRRELLAQLRVRFVDEEHRPVEGVSVQRRFDRTGDPRLSDTDGEIHLSFTPSGPKGHTGFKFQRNGFANDSFEVRVQPGGKIDYGEILLHRGGALSGRVVDELGMPLPNAQVRVEGQVVNLQSGEGRSMSRSSDLGAARTTSDAEGRFRLTGLIAGEVRVLAKTADELHQGESGRVEIRPGHESAELVLVAERIPEELRIEGVVLDPFGEPVSWMPVSARYSTLWQNASLGTSTREDGRFRLILPKELKVELRIPAPEDKWPTLILKNVPTGSLDLELRFEEADPLKLQIVKDGKGPLPEVVVTVSSTDGERTLQDISSTADENGMLRLRRPEERFRIRVLAQGHAAAELGPLDPSDVTPLRIGLIALPGITGMVLSQAGFAAGAKLSVHALAQNRIWCDGSPVWVEPTPSTQGTADDEGLFRLTLRDPGRYILRAELQGHAPTEHGPFDYIPSQGIQGLTLRLDQGGAIEGRVVRADELRTSSLVLISRGDAYAELQRTSPDGSFRFEHLTPGPWQIRRVPQSFRPGSSSSQTGTPYRRIEADCHVFENETTHFNLMESAPGQSVLRGRLKLAGAEGTEWTAKLISPDQRPISGPAINAPLDARGGFVFEAQLSGRYWLIVAPTDELRGPYFSIELDLVKGDQTWEAEVALGHLTLQGLPLPPNGVPMAVRWSGQDGLWAHTLALAEDTEPAELLVPAGVVEVVRQIAPDQEDPREWQVIGEALVRPGETTSFEF